MFVTYLIIGVTCVVSFLAMQNPELKYKMLFIPERIKHGGETYRWLSGGFVHADWMHLAFNMYTLYIFAWAAEGSFENMLPKGAGGAAYLIFYLALIALASYPDYKKYQDYPGYRALGASGAVSGMIWPLIFIKPWEPVFWDFIPPLVWGVGYIIYSAYADKRGGSNIGHGAHLWGSVFGFLGFTLICLIFAPGRFYNFLDLLTFEAFNLT